MRKSILTIAAIAASVFVLGKADAMPLNSGLGDAADRVSAVEKTQFVYLGRNYCWYPDGWHGPGDVSFQMRQSVTAEERVEIAEEFLKSVTAWRDQIVTEVERARTAIDELAAAREEIARLKAESEVA